MTELDASVTTAAIGRIAGALERLDARRHVTPARLELSCDAGQWTAMIMADPLRRPLSASASTPDAALRFLAVHIVEYDWRRIRR